MSYKRLSDSTNHSAGRMIPSTLADQYAPTLARWFGVRDIDLDFVAPNLVNFAQRDLGFMIA